MSSTPPTIPEGFKQNARGHLVPESMIKPIDLLRDQTAQRIAEHAKELQQQMLHFKRQSFEDMAAFVATSNEQYEVKVGGEKGNVRITTYDGRYKVERSFQDLIRFDEQLGAAKALLENLLNEWTEDGRAEVKVLVSEAFEVNKSGSIRTSKVLELLRYNITDPRWVRAMEAIRNAIQVVDTKPYVRVYERVGSSDRYQPISLDIAKL